MLRHTTNTHRHRPAQKRAHAVVARASSTSGKPRAVVIGGGWGGLGAAYAMQEAGVDVVILDAAPSPGGLSSAWRSAAGRLVEPGIKGFWYQYANIFKLCDTIGIPDPFTPWTSSSFYSPKGLQVRAPIFSKEQRLPTPLGSFLYTNPFFTNLPIADRLTALPLVRALLEYNVDEATYQEYDAMSARELFRQAGVSRRLYEEFLEPMLQVTLFLPGERLSAAAALDALYFFVLQHQESFDVKWCRGAVGERIMQPLVKHLEAIGATLLGGRKVVEVIPQGGENGTHRVVAKAQDGAEEVWDADALVFAVGVSAMQRIVATSPGLASKQQFTAFNNLETVDVMALRVWLDKHIRLATPSNVLVGFDKGVGSTLFDLNELQDEYSEERGSVMEMDFYNASTLLPLSDDALKRRLLDTYLPPLVSPGDAKITDVSVARFRNAVTGFTPGSYKNLPWPESSINGMFFAGDWVRQPAGRPQGLSQEKAYVTGLQAGNGAVKHCRLQPTIQIAEVEPDEAHVEAGKQLAKEVKKLGLQLPKPADFGIPQLLGW